MNASSIEWTDRTWNPVSGCSHVSEGCRNCYAERFFPRVYGTERVPIVKNSIRTLDPANFDEFNSRMRSRKFTDVQCHPDRLDQPLKIKKPQKIFVNSMSDLFHEDVSDVFIADVFATMALCPRHNFQILTKRPARMQHLLSGNGDLGPFDGQIGVGMEWRTEHTERMETAIMTFPYPLPNVWLGVSVEDQQTADERIPILLQTPSAVRWISAEPLLGPVKLLQSDLSCFSVSEGGRPDPEKIDWVVCGGESGTKARPMHPEWVRSIRDQCQSAGVPFFMKQWGEWEINSAANGHYNCNMETNGAVWVHHDGKITSPSAHRGRVDSGASAYSMIRVGKKMAGSLLDGREWKEFPKTP